MSTETPSAVILAGGESSRFGAPKPWATFLGRTMLQRVVDALQRIASDIVVVKAPGQELPEVESRLPVQIVEDTVPGEGPARGLLTGMSGLAWPTFAVSCDVPALEPAVLSLLTEKLHNRDAAVPVIEGVPQPLVALYRAGALVPVLEQQLAHGNRSLLAALDNLHVAWLDEDRLRHADPHLLSFRGVNTPDELAALEDAFRGARLDG